jgi:hypothetical protein
MEEDGGKSMLQEMTWFPSFDPTAAPFFLLLSTVGHEPKIGTDGPKKKSCSTAPPASSSSSRQNNERQMLAEIYTARSFHCPLLCTME